MNEKNLRLLKYAAIEILNSLHEDDYFSVIEFSNEAVVSPTANQIAMIFINHITDATEIEAEGALELKIVNNYVIAVGFHLLQSWRMLC